MFNGFDIGTAQEIYYGSNLISELYYGSKKLWPLYDAEYLTFEVVTAGDITFKADNANNTKTIEYSTDDGTTWTQITSTTSGASLGTFAIGDIVKVKGNNSSYGNNTTIQNNKFGGTAEVNVYGNIMSLIYGDNFYGNNTLVDDFTFMCLFYGNTGLLSIENLVLPATTLTESCYQEMFENCTNLTTSLKKLPATTLSDGCYCMMFEGCSSLTNSPKLKGTTLAESCYQEMFKNCVDLVDAPELIATTLTVQGYYEMFYGCSSLVDAPALPATTLANDCYIGMFEGCTSLENAPALPATTITQGCYSSMFNGCTSLEKAPALPATTLVQACYYHMFYGCSSLNYIKCMATSGFGAGSTTDWVTGVAATGTFVSYPNTTWSTGTSGIPTGWTVQSYALPNIPFSFNYNAKHYDDSTMTLYKETGQLVDQNATITKSNGEVTLINNDYIEIRNSTSGLAAVLSGTYNQYIGITNASPVITIIFKARTLESTSGTKANIFANRMTYNYYNYMVRLYTNKLEFTGSGIYPNISITDASIPHIMSIRIDSNRIMHYNNWTENTSLTSTSQYSAGPANTGNTSCLFNGISDMKSEQWNGDFYWIYLSLNELTDAQVQQVIEYNENITY